MEDFDFKSARRSFSYIGTALILFHAVTFIAQRITVQILRLAAPSLIENGIPALLNLALSSATMYLIGLPIYYMFLKNIPTDAPAKNGIRISVLWASFLITFALSYFGEMIGTAVAGMVYELAGKAVDSGTIGFISSLKWYESFIITVIIGPLAEEFMFRRMIIDRTRAYGEKLSVIFSALMFAFFHMSIIQFFYAFAVGLLLGYLYIRKGRLLYCWIIHALFNFFCAVVPKLIIEYTDYMNIVAALENPDAMYKIIEEQPVDIWIICGYGLMTLIFAFAGCTKFGKMIKKMHFEKTSLELPKDTEATTAFINTGVILFVLLAIAYPFMIAA